jgi:hypothetical protein
MSATLEIEGGLDASIESALDVIAWEIELAGARCIQLDSIIGEVIEQLPPESQARMLEGLHAVDLLSQHLTGISAFARDFSSAVPEEARANVGEALGKITLGALADRMCAALGGVEKGLSDGDGAGDLDLF